MNAISKSLDIHSGGYWPSTALSNFALHAFEFDGISCKCMEAFLQSLKIKDPATQAWICTLGPRESRREGMTHDWKVKKILYWKGVSIYRDSEDYQCLIDYAYDMLFEQSESFREALMATGDLRLTHSIGKLNKDETLLTQEEFCSRLTNLRSRLLQPTIEF